MKKFTWIFGLALLWGGLNAVAQTDDEPTVKEVGNFKQLEEAVKKIPQFEVVRGKKTAYNNAKAALEKAQGDTKKAKTAYETARADSTKTKAAYDEAYKEVTDAQTIYNAAVEKRKTTEARIAALEGSGDEEGLIAKAQGDLEKKEEDLSKIQLETQLRPTPTTEDESYPEYTDMYVFLKKGDTTVPRNIGFVVGIIHTELFFLPNTVIFVPYFISPEAEEHNAGDYVIGAFATETAARNVLHTITDLTAEYTDAFTIPNLYNTTIAKKFNTFTFDEISYNKDSWNIQFYYNEYQDENNSSVKYSSYEFEGSLASPIAAFRTGYDKIKRKPLKWKEVEVETTEYTEALTEVDNAQKALNDLKAELENLKSSLSDLKNDVIAAGLALTSAQNNFSENPASDNYKKARDKADTTRETYYNAIAAETPLRTAVESAKEDYNKEAAKIAKVPAATDDDGLTVCEDEYTTIDITADFTDGVSTITKWPAGYTLNGNGHIINVAAGKALFTTNEGTIDGLATPNGRIATNNNGTVTNSLTLWGNEYHAYNEVAKQFVDDSAEGVIYKMRSALDFPFGYDVMGKKVKPLEDENGNYKLYEGKYTNTKKEPTSFKFNISNSSWKINQNTLNEMVTDGKAINENAIFYIENNDAIGTGIENVKNIAIKGENTTSPYTCNNTELTDEDNARKFYIPMDFIAKKVTYGRSFNQKYAAVCFPFTLTTDMQEELGIDAAYQFKEVKEGVMWFSLLDEAPANQPCLIVFKDENFEEDNIPGNIFNKYAGTSSFSFVSTPDELVATDTHGDKTFYGTYKLSTVRTLLGNNSTDAIYGIQKGELVKMTRDDIKFKAFRGYVRTPKVSTTAGAPSFKIGLMDEDGNELSTAIETVSGEIVSGFKAKGGDNAIEIITDKACQVKVYALNGALVKSTRVEAGVTSLPVKAGMYVVNGAKVIVK